MAFTNIPNGNLQVGAPLRSVDILALRDNIPAVMNGDTGAPKIKAAAFEGQSGAAPVFASRAWVNFNGEGTASVRASGNVSSVTDNGLGDFTINFATALPDSNYALNGTCSSNSNIQNFPAAVVTISLVGALTATTARILTGDSRNGNRQDMPFVCITISR